MSFDFYVSKYSKRLLILLNMKTKDIKNIIYSKK